MPSRLDYYEQQIKQTRTEIENAYNLFGIALPQGWRVNDLTIPERKVVPFVSNQTGGCDNLFRDTNPSTLPFPIGDGQSISYMFYGCNNLSDVLDQRYNFIKTATNSVGTFYGTSITRFNMGNPVTLVSQNTNQMFMNSKLRVIPNMTLTNSTNAWRMFFGCTSIGAMGNRYEFLNADRIDSAFQFNNTGIKNDVFKGDVTVVAPKITNCSNLFDNNWCVDNVTLDLGTRVRNVNITDICRNGDFRSVTIIGNATTTGPLNIYSTNLVSIVAPRHNGDVDVRNCTLNKSVIMAFINQAMQVTGKTIHMKNSFKNTFTPDEVATISAKGFSLTGHNI